MKTVEDLRAARTTHSYLDATSTTHDVATHISCYAARVKDLKATAIATRNARELAYSTYSAAYQATDAAWYAYNAANHAVDLTAYAAAFKSKNAAWDAYKTACKTSRKAAKTYRSAKKVKDWDVDKMSVESYKGAAVAKKKLIKYYSCEGESNYYKKYYYMEKLASYGHIPAMKTLEIMKQDGVGCDRTLESKQDGVECDKTLGMIDSGLAGFFK